MECWVPIDSKPYCSSSGFDAVSTLFQEIIAALNSLNVVVEQGCILIPISEKNVAEMSVRPQHLKKNVRDGAT
ncbi:hypothetical protein Gogos_018172 [Gossypium gossypioides]|uniref:Uncharacterized protein n=1 Tax=Gossypium gossypioides TaxID=34282 RepID=A0A7J9BD22_GOSGO|nr:hypothetical protein [Gossypium gossypioides]